MIANQDTMVHTFWDCNAKYFNHALPTPLFETVNRVDILARFEYYRNKKNSKKPIRNQTIMMSDCFNFPEKNFIETMVHEMIHYYIAWNRIKDNKSHGKEFMRIANEMNEKYGLNITKTIDASVFPLTEKAPKIIKKKRFFDFLFGMHMKLSKLLFVLFTLIWVSCECPYQDEQERAYQRTTNTKGDVLYADMLLGTWQCYYPMIIGGMEFKQIKFISGGKADITMAKQYDTEWNTVTYDYAYYGNTLRFSRNGSNISFQIEEFLFPELYLRDSLGRYTMAKRSAAGC